MSTFTPNRDTFAQRTADQQQATRQTVAVAKAHMGALCRKLSAASTQLELGALGTAGATLALARNDLDAAIKALPH